MAVFIQNYLLNFMKCIKKLNKANPIQTENNGQLSSYSCCRTDKLSVHFMILNQLMKWC